MNGAPGPSGVPDPPPAAHPYAFGDDATAQHRLDLLHHTFAPATTALLATVADRPPALAADLGCGVGNTTVLVHEVTGARRTVGLDASTDFLASARRRWADRPDIEFVDHDVRATPFPLPAVDLLFARLLVGHLPDASRVLGRWETQLAPGGRLVLDEVEWIRTTDPVLEAYLELATALLVHGGGCMCAGPLIDAHQPQRAVKRHSIVTEFEVPAAIAAELFSLNLAVFGPRATALGLIGPPARARMAEELGQRRQGGAGEPPLTWGLRQIVLQAADG